LLREGSNLSVGTPLPKGVSIDQVVAQCAERGGWTQTKQGWKRAVDKGEEKDGQAHIRRGVGFACGYKNVGFSFGAPEQCTAIVELHGSTEIEELVLRHAGADVGQGSHTVMAQMAADAAGVPLEKVRLVASDTATSGDSGSASASRMTFMSGNSIRGAVAAALEKWQAEERPAVARYQFRPPATSPYDAETGECEPNFAYGYVAEIARVEVDTETGQVRLVEVICANDVGKAVNPLGVRGQIEGAIVQASGYALLEDFQQPGGYVQTGLLSTYLIPTVRDIPERIDPIIIETADPIGPWGARGMGEMPYIPLAPAVAAAVKDATGIWIDEFPLTPERVLRYLSNAG
jgi:CO/xanthine dehydrogenase Mo-binding subunit